LKKSIADANKTIDALMKQISEIQMEDQEKYNKLKKDLGEENETLLKKLEEYESTIKKKSEGVEFHLIFFFL